MGARILSRCACGRAKQANRPACVACREKARRVRAEAAKKVGTCSRCGQACSRAGRMCLACRGQVQRERREQRAALCRHCKVKRVNRHRGLCWTCYHTPSIRQAYATDSTYGQIGHGADVAGGYALPDRPTDTIPGSEERIRVLQERAAQGVSLFHPADARRELTPAEERRLRARMAGADEEGDSEEDC